MYIILKGMSTKTILITWFITGIITIGWVKNLVKLTKCDFKAPYKAEIIHVIGVITPIGVVTGWLNLEDYK